MTLDLRLKTFNSELFVIGFSKRCLNIFFVYNISNLYLPLTHTKNIKLKNKHT
jgi:hypothetical protein